MAAPNYFFQNNSNFLNIFYALDIGIENHFASMLLNNDLDRVVYASTQHALRKRTRGVEWDAGFLPFMNYRANDIERATQRDIESISARVRGIYVPELSKYIKATPITISYDATVWYHQPLDNIFAFSEIIWDDDLETVIDYSVSINDIEGNPHDVKLFGLLGYNYSYQPTFEQADWLNENMINSISLNFNFQTYIIKEGAEAWIPDTVVFEFAHSKGLDPTEYDTTIEFMQSYFE